MKRILSAKLALGLSLLSQISPAHTQEYLSPGYILSEIQQSMGFYKIPDAPNFVKQARPEPSSLAYQPLKPPPRDLHSEANKPANQIEAETPTIAELEAARARNQLRSSQAGAQKKAQAKQQDAAGEGGPAPMKWNPWDTE